MINHTTSQNCIVCAEEFTPDEMTSEASIKVNTTFFKVCQKCLDLCDPNTDYVEAKKIIDSYLRYSNVKELFVEAKEIIDSIKTSE